MRIAHRPHPDAFGGPSHACHGKRRFGRNVARRVARQINDAQLEPVHAYPCPTVSDITSATHYDQKEEES